jgi:outer membrane protein assembly factor BamB
VPPILLALLIAPAADPVPATWPQWRGPARDGFAAGPDWPDTLAGDALTQRWRVEELGPSYSGPVVGADRVFITETVDKMDEVVRCLDRATGKELWRKTWPGSLTVPFFADRNGGWIRSTPAYDGEALYVAGIRDVLVCLGGKDGKERWRFDFVTEFKAPPPAIGCVCSPLVDVKAVYVQAGAALVKIDKRAGMLLWKTLEDGGGMYGSAFSSPVVATVAGREQLLVQTRQKLAGVDREKGGVLWSRPIPAERGMNILSPVPLGDGVFTSSYGGGTRLVTVAKGGAKFDTAEPWSTKYQGYMTTPVVIDGHAYLLGRDRRLVCIDLKTGAEAWRTEKRFGDYWSMVARKDKILALDQTGKLYLFRADPKQFDLLDEREVAKSETWAHLAVCGDELFVRDLIGLSAFRWRGK